jgi:DNA modification methylase
MKTIDSNYEKFLKSKINKIQESGFEPENLNSYLFDFQKFIVSKACKMGRYAIFADCGLGKTLMQLSWAEQVRNHTKSPVLILAPLAVVKQTIQEGTKFGIDVSKFEFQTEQGIYITNYEQLKNIDVSIFSGIVLDESSILKNFTGANRNLIIDLFSKTPYKLACTATPSPNDEIEIGNHSEFLNIMNLQDMQAKYFTTDKSLTNGQKWRLKKHAISEFYGWVSSWAIMLSNPSDIGFDGSKYILPKLNYIQKQIITDKKDDGKLFNDIHVSATTFNKELKITLIPRMEMAAELVNNSDENFIVWVNQNAEDKKIRELIPDAVSVCGSEKPEQKANKLLGFANDEFRVLVTKKKIASFGMNYQNCRNQIFAALDFSFESLYQAIRRSYRFGQKQDVNIYIITTDTMENVMKSIETKKQKYNMMKNEMQNAYNESYQNDDESSISGNIYETDNFKLINGDCVIETRKHIKDESIDYTFFSPPFGAMYVFSNDPHDMSNVNNNDEFMNHFDFLVKELLRITKPGRLVSLHMMQSTTLKGRDGFYSIVDFRGDLIRIFQKNGFYFHAENMIRKDPKTAAIRTKNRQLMHGTTKKDSSIVRPGLADYILTFRKPGENLIPIQNDIPFDLWCQIAEPVWIDIHEGDTIQYRDGRDKKDERHITPTQLKTIDNCLNMWCNKGETVFSPFSGIGSEGYQSLITGRNYIGIELKESYFNQSIKNLLSAEQLNSQTSLF